MADIKNPERQGFESSGGASGQGEGIREQAHEASAKAQEAAAAARDRVTEQAYSYADKGKQRLADTINDIAVSIREAGHKLHEEHQEGPAGYVDSTADQIERMARYLQQRDVHELYESVENTARQHPAAFIGATFAAGLLAARFLRSSTDRQRGSQSQSSSHPGGQSEAFPSYRASREPDLPTAPHNPARSRATDRPGEDKGSPSPDSPSNVSGPYPPESSQGTKPSSDQSSKGGESI